MRDANLTACSDEELFARTRRGEESAFTALVRRYERELYGYLHRYLGDAALADDVFQNTFLQVHVKRDAYQDGRPFRPWLYAIATNQAIDSLRRKKRHAAVSLEQQTGEDANGEVRQLLDLLETQGESPIDAVSLDERRRMVRESVEQLPDFLKQVVLLAYFQGLPYRDVAAALDIPVGTVKSRLNSALHKLHAAWSQCSSVPESE